MPPISTDALRTYLSLKAPWLATQIAWLPDGVLFAIGVGILIGIFKPLFDVLALLYRTFFPKAPPPSLLSDALRADLEEYLRDRGGDAGSIAELEVKVDKLLELLQRATASDLDPTSIAAKHVAVQGLIADKDSVTQRAIQVFTEGNVVAALGILTQDAQATQNQATESLGSRSPTTDISNLESEAERLARLAARKWRRIGTLQLGIDNNAALRAFQASLAFDDSSAGIQIEVARLLAKSDDIAGAEARYRAVIERFGSKPSLAVANAWSALGRLLRKQKRWDEAKDAHANAERIRRKSNDYVGWSQSLGALGDLELTRGRMSQAARLHTKALQRARGYRLPEQRAYNHMRLGQILLNMAQPARAKDEFKKAIALEPNGGRNLVHQLEGLASAHIVLGEFEAARHKLEDAIKRSRDADSRVRILTTTGQLSMERGMLDDAISKYSEAVNVAKGSERPFFRYQLDQIARVRGLQGAHAEAAEAHAAHAREYQKRDELDRWAECQLNLARACVAQRKPEPARQALHAARQRFREREHFLLLADCLAVEAELLRLERARTARKFAHDAVARYRSFGALFKARVLAERLASL